MVASLLAFFAGPLGRWVIIAGLLASVATAAYWRAYNAGYAKHEAETSAEVAEANTRERIKERAANTRMAALAAAKHQEIENARIETDRLRAAVRSGARRLSIPGACVPAGPDPAPAARPGGEARTELAAETADALVAIAADGDAAIRQANALIDAYAIAVDVCGK